MPPIGPENFHRLEEFPSFVSCIRSFGKSIIPPLLIPSRRHELKELAIAAVKKEEEILRKRKIIRETKDVHASPEFDRDSSRSHSQSDMQESCALWYPSAKDYPEGISIAISKFPTSGIYSSVHTDSIVCSNVVESESIYSDAIMRNSLLVPESNAVNCFECSHDNMNMECSLCQAEYNQDFSKSFASEVSPEVPCRTYSLLQHSGIDKDESSYTVETDCESLPTVIFNKKCIPNDTDTESTATYMTQSTDLEKYMEFSCEFSSPDCSALTMDSKSASQQYMYSRSDDVSSETIVNTENELTPCASTMAELTDNIEDELSNAEDIALASDNKEVFPGRMKRAHSVDSYMKILQTSAENTSVRKSLSDSFDGDLKVTADLDVEKRPPINLKTSFLIKEDSKESEEAKELPEKDVSETENVQQNSHDEHKSSEVKTDSESQQKRHVRQNSYTLDHPSSALILAHANCTCNFDTNCISPHCSALAEESEGKFKSAFMKEKVEVNIPKSQDQMKNLSLLNPVCSHEDIAVNLEEMTTTVDVFPIVNERSSEKSDSGNAEQLEVEHVAENVSPAKTFDSSKEEEEHLKEMFSKYFDASDRDRKQEYFQEIYKKLQESHEKRVKKLFKQQNQEWSNLQEELKQEMILCQNLKPTILAATEIGPPLKVEERDQIKSADCCSDEMTGKETLFDKRLAISNSSISSSNQIPTVGNSLNQNLEFPIRSESLQSQHSPSKSLLPEKSRASISPSKNLDTFNISPSAALRNINNTFLFAEPDSSLNCSYNTNDVGSSSHESTSNMNCPPRATLPPRCNSAPHPPNVISNTSGAKCDNMYFYDSSSKQDEGCSSLNGYCDCDINFLHSEYMPDRKLNSISSYNNLSSTVHLSRQSHNSESTSDVLSESFSAETLLNCQDTDCVRDVGSSSSTLNNSKFPTVMDDKEKRNVTHDTSKDDSKFPVKNLFSVCANTLKNGTLCSGDNIRVVVDPVLLKKFEKLPAFVKGYLTRRLFKTERVGSLIKTLKDTIILIEEFNENLSRKEYPVSERDVHFHRQLVVQLVTTFQNLYNIFCTISTKERMNIIAESRNFRRKSETGEKPELDNLVIAKTSDLAPAKTHQLTSASVKALERKKKSSINSRTYTKEDFKKARSRSVLEMRTYTIDDMPNFTGSMSSKSVSVSPSSGFRGNTGMKRKTSSAKSRQCLHHHKWVP